ncbi:hypothetical protein MMC07_005528 [Pseudocyphellaria aurata]|nr:hypothetical protein [Pseudocyphellaria aurata]
MALRSIFVASLGNPNKYLNTLHSAGHIVLASLVSELSYPPLERSRHFGNALVSAGPEFTLWQSPSMMNLSGPPLAAAWSTFLRSLPSKEERKAARLVVLHDELESPLGKAKARSGGSTKGHNGLKSCVGTLGAKAFVRIGIGIGRPESRDSDDVSRFVLRRTTAVEADAIKNAAGPVVALLTELREEGE